MDNYKLCTACALNYTNRKDCLCNLCFSKKKELEEQKFKDFYKPGPITVTKLPKLTVPIGGLISQQSVVEATPITTETIDKLTALSQKQQENEQKQVEGEKEKEKMQVDEQKMVTSKIVENSHEIARSFYRTMENVIKIYWNKVYLDKPFKLVGAIFGPELVDDGFYDEELEGMEIIYQECVDVLAGGSFTADTLNMLLKKLTTVTAAVERKMREKDIVEIEKNEEPQNGLVNESIKKVDEPNKKATFPSFTLTSVDVERQYFWGKLEAYLHQIGDPFHIETREHYATVDKKSANSSLCLGLDFLVQKEFFRINLYIQDNFKTPHFERLKMKRELIEAELGFQVMWNMGAKNINTRRIEIHLPFKAYDHKDYERLIKTVVPKIAQFKKVFSKYCPEAFY